MKKINSKLFLLLFVLSLLIISFAGISYAWFTQVKRTGAVYFKTGEVVYKITDDSFKNCLVDKEYIVPGEELIKTDNTIYIINNSTLATNLRVKGYITINGQTYELNGNKNDDITETFDSRWVYNETDKCFYAYETVNNVSEESIFAAVEVDVNGPKDVNINLIESLILNGTYIGNAASAHDVEITLIFQGKQSNYATWSDLGSLTINLGN